MAEFDRFCDDCGNLLGNFTEERKCFYCRQKLKFLPKPKICEYCKIYFKSNGEYKRHRCNGHNPGDL